MAVPMVTLRTPSRHEQADRHVARVTLWILALLSAWFCVTILYPWNPVTKLKIAVVGQPQIGQAIVVEVDYCKTRAWTPLVIRWSLVNDITVVLPQTTISLPVGCHIKRISVPLPIHTIPGTYRMREEVFYQPWPWRTIAYDAESALFSIKGTP